MFRNYLKIAWRNLRKNSGFTFINVFGLSVGIAACLLISVYIMHESSYDKDVENAENTYRLISSFNDENRIEWGLHFSANTAPTILHDFDEVVNSGRLMDNNLFYGAGANEIRIEGQQRQYHEEGFSYADPSMLDIMDVKMVYGDRKALDAPNSIVISEKVAKKFFGQDNPIGKAIYLNGNSEDPRTIGGVMKEFPSNSHLYYDYLLTLSGVEFGQGEQTRWIQSNYFTYLVLKPGTDIEAFNKKLNRVIVGNYMKQAFKDAGYALWEIIEDVGHLEVQSLTDINLHSNMIGYEEGKRNDIKIIWIFGIVAAFILLIASINFVNLSTAKSANRAKEVGLRKVVGSDRKGLISQFLTESLLVTFIAFVIGSFLAILFLPAFREMSGIELSIPWSNPFFIPSILFTAILVGLLAGMYPSFYLSSFNPISVLKGKLRMGSKSGGLRSSLVVFQFTVSIVLIIGTLIVSNQLDFILNSKIGFEKDQVVQVYGTNMLGDQVRTFKDELKSISGVESVSISDFLPIEGTKRNGNSVVNEGRDNIDQTVGIQAWVVDEDYLQTLGMSLREGRNFDRQIKSDEQNVILNEEAARQLNLENPVGKRISRYGTLYKIIGIVNDFNFNSMTADKVQPLALFYGLSPSIVSVKIKAADTHHILSEIEKNWNTFAPNLAFRYQFMDDSFAHMYDKLSRIRTIFITFAVLALVVACLGLFALSAYLVEQRSKEMSIRKVLGASFRSIFQILTQNFLGLVALSLAIAIPIAWYFMNIWLQDYAYRIEIGWSVFVIAGLSAIGVAILTVSFHAIKAALVNPVENLKSE
ncbi:ABC transporter permease [Marinilongibacter aquaticus]|uniref:ABC transporter permease n=1 Tax=Marinilongibacter aquaticus TaxID=2975157 RepID=UPI0021BD8CE0|nr:ABC transporter permease [Marinilongibacter aquaticus]UBM57296.1 ABC transporter permease [Marinilongibacter aquaticus]